ncbi:hypothetical protein, partial [Pseudomonas syringae]|uniref:hypothetical protein n=1 Tax=Pseudomonas syringae TaxID=317 RepID=UPI001F343E28
NMQLQTTKKANTLLVFTVLWWGILTTNHQPPTTNHQPPNTNFNAKLVYLVEALQISIEIVLNVQISPLAA